MNGLTFGEVGTNSGIELVAQDAGDIIALSVENPGGPGFHGDMIFMNLNRAQAVIMRDWLNLWLAK